MQLNQTNRLLPLPTHQPLLLDEPYMTAKSCAQLFEEIETKLILACANKLRVEVFSATRLYHTDVIAAEYTYKYSTFAQTHIQVERP